MKTTFTLLLLAVFTFGVNAQILEDFELEGSDTVWNQFANDGDAPENFFRTDNPVFNGINESDYSLQFNVLETADTWVGAWSDAYGPIEITSDRYMIEMMVLKDVVTSCAFKVEAPDEGLTPVEVHSPNTVTDEWELITFDMSEAIGNIWTRLVFFPDFPSARESGSTCYIDDIAFPFPVSANSPKMEGIRIYPNPVAERMTIRYPEMENAVISNALGQTVRYMEFRHSSLEHIDLSGIQPGLYFITVESAGEKVTSKFIRE
jgi:hypothetical protein